MLKIYFNLIILSKRKQNQVFTILFSKEKKVLLIFYLIIRDNFMLKSGHNAKNSSKFGNFFQEKTK